MLTIRKYQNRHPKLGRHVLHDSRSLAYKFNLEGLMIRDVVHDRHIPILDQGDVGSCTAEAGIGNLATTPIYETIRSGYSLDQAGAYALYNDEENLDQDGPYPPNDNGSTGLTCAKVLQKAGIIFEYRHVFDMDSALKALSVTPFMFGTDWYDTMMNPDSDGRVKPIGNVIGGHEILCRELRGERVWFDNSWGDSWGVGGRFYLTRNDFAKLLNAQGDVIILIPSGTPKPHPPHPPHPQHPIHPHAPNRKRSRHHHHHHHKRVG